MERKARIPEAEKQGEERTDSFSNSGEDLERQPDPDEALIMMGMYK